MLKHLINTLLIVFISVNSFFVTVQHASAQNLPIRSSFYDVEYRQMAVNIEIDQYGDLIVTERMEVLFNESRRGIFRYIPFVYSKNLFIKTSTPIRLISLTRNGQPEEFITNREEAVLFMRIGNENTYLQGEQIYEVKYSVKDVIVSDKNIDLLYWNITGNDWERPWQNVESTFIFPTDVAIGDITCFTGVIGSTEQNCNISVNRDVVSITANDYLTARIEMAPNSFLEKSFGYYLIKAIRDNVYVLIITLVLAYLMIQFWRRGRELKMNTVITEFDPPKNMNIEDLSYFYGSHTAGNLLTALIISLAARGFIDIKVIPKSGLLGSESVEITKINDDVSSLPPYEQRVFREILQLNDRSSMSLNELKNNRSMGLVISKMIGEINTRENVLGIAKSSDESKAFAKKVGWQIIPIIVLTILLAIIGGMTGYAPVVISDILLLLFGSIASIILIAFLVNQTPEYIEMRRQVLGFKNFMHVAERYRSEWQERVGEFAKYLPFAILFGDVKKWLKFFGTLPNVENNSTIAIGTITATSFNSISSIANSINSSVNSAVSTSSSGSSGGGSGGGGGGSW
jgi:uncharacterized membrane protein